MLSYRHAYHAGNFADVLKHIVLIEMLDHLCLKDSAFDYVDTHAGAGYYDLGSSEAQKLGEFAGGVGKLKPDQFPELARYFEIIGAHNRSDKLRRYPGSPAIAKYFLRDQDRAWLYELHPKDCAALRKAMGGDRRIRVFEEDGLKGLGAVLPPRSRRGLVLIDPSYEIKTDYAAVVKALRLAVKRFATGTFALWYPVVERAQVDQLERKLKASDIPNIQRFELGVHADAPGHGMTAAGMFVVNPPWTLLERMSALLPRLADTLGVHGKGACRCDIIVTE